jgi:hypothetical protein
MRTTAVVRLLGLLVLAGCSGIQVESEFAPGASLEGFETYAWLEHPAEAGYLRAESRFMEARIFTAVDSAMTSKGYRKSEEAAAADFLVVYQVTGTDGIQAGHTYGTFGYTTPRDRIMWPVGPSMPYTKGTLIVDIVSPDMDLLWRGSASGSLEVPNQGELAKAVYQSAARIIGRLPRAS